MNLDGPSEEKEKTGERQRKVLIWTTPRSISTAFLRSLMEIPNSKCFIEEYLMPYYYGEDKTSPRFPTETISGVTFEAISNKLSSACHFAGYVTVIGKEMAYSLAGRLSNTKFIPPDYIHTFLIRNPRQSIPSLYLKSMNDPTVINGGDCGSFEAAEASYAELWQIYELVSAQQRYKPVVIEAEDFLEKPEVMLRAYCDAVGLPFSTNMLNWNKDADVGIITEKPFDVDWWYGDVLKSTGINPDIPRFNKQCDKELPAEVIAAIEAAEPYYKKLREKRLIPP